LLNELENDLSSIKSVNEELSKKLISNKKVIKEKKEDINILDLNFPDDLI